jgi:iron complex outermembrane receptor protein
MRLKLLVLCSTSTLVLTAAPVFAQTASQATAPIAGQEQATPPAAPAAAQDNQNSPAGGTPAAAQDAAVSDSTAASDSDALNASGGDVVVTGLRRSLASAQAIKRNSDQQVDSIVASDIGKLPDVAISDTAARIPGVQVDRSGGEASRVLVRGLPDFTTTYNGREIFTAEARSVALQDFPAGAISALEVFKTTTADLVEGGLAGEVNVRSRKPFDFDGLEVAGSAWGQYEKRSKDWNPNGNLLVSDRWQTGIGEVGALINFSYTSLDYLDSTRSNTDFIANPTVAPANTALRFPDIQRIDYGEGKRSRPSLNGALQWRPRPGLEFYAEALWQGFRNEVSDRETEVPLYGGASYNNVVTQAGSNLANSFTVVNPNRPDGFQGATYGKTDTYQYAVGGKWDGGKAHLSFDVARTATKYLDSVYSLDMAYASPQTVTVNTGLAGQNVGPTFALSNANPNDPNNYIFRGFFDRQLVARGEDWQARVDGNYETGLSFLPKIEAGFRYVDRDAHFEDGSRYVNKEGDRIPYSSLPLDFEQSESGFPSDDLSPIRGYYTATYDSLRNNIAALRQFVGFPDGTPPPDPLATYTSNEKSYAGYGQLRYQVGSDTGIRVDGVVGVRYVHTDFTIDGTSVAQATGGGPNIYTPVSTTQGYDDWLPNASARIRFTDKLQLRLSATKTRTRPGFASFDPAINAGSPPGCEFITPAGGGATVLVPASQNPNAASCVRFASGGNAALQPTKSNNYDASLEYYFSRTGQAAVAVFRRDLNGFLLNSTSDTTDENGYILRVTAPYNSGSGRIQGVEALFTTFLDFDALPGWMHSFGIDSNVTYLDAKTGQIADGTTNLSQRVIPGVSNWAYNVAGIYEHGGLSTRLSWNWRSSYLSTLQVRDVNADGNAATNDYNLYSERVHGIGRLDFSGSYDVNKHLTLTADWTNILAKPFRSDLTYNYFTGDYAGTSASLPRLVRYEESVYSAGIRFRF